MSEQKDQTVTQSSTVPTITDNMVVSFHYRLCEEFADGTRSEWAEDSHGGQPLLYLHGFHNVVVGLEKALSGKSVGDKIAITLKPDDAYGQRQPNAVQRVPIKHLQFPNHKKPRVGSMAAVQTNKGPRKVIVLKLGKFSADVDFNHPYAGRRLYYEIEVVSVREATAEELAHGHAHGAGGHHHS